MTGAWTRSKIAQTARERMRQRNLSPELANFAGTFPTLVESCGLAHAVALAKAQGHGEYLEDLAAVLAVMGHDELASAASLEQATLQHSVTGYVHLTCNTLQAATCLSECVAEPAVAVSSRSS